MLKKLLPWEKLDVVTFSWQKVLGGEAAHGVIILSPKALRRLEVYVPAWPIPKLFKLTKGNKPNLAIFKGSTINTPSMLCVEDYLVSLRWVQSLGGVKQLINRSKQNLATIIRWVSETNWLAMLPKDADTISSTSICLQIVDEKVTNLQETEQRGFIKDIVDLLAEEGVAFDIEGYRNAPPGFRIWGGGTVESADIESLCEWLEWAYFTVETNYFKVNKSINEE